MDKMSLIALAKASKAGGGGGSFTQEQADWNQTDNTQVDFIKNKPNFSTVATSGSYDDLTNKPAIPEAYTLPTASTDTLGGVKVDGTSITINNGVIHATQPVMPTVDTELDPTSDNAIANSAVSTEVTALSNDIDLIESNILSTKTTAKADIVSITDAQDIPAEDVKADIEPIQDLHGYEYPWVGGAGKNIFDEIYTNISDTVIYRAIAVPNGTYTMSTTCTKNTIGAANLFILSGNVSAGASSGDNGVWNTVPRTITVTDGYLTVAYRNEYDVDPSNYNTQIEAGTQPTSYEPYSNICPITGYDEVSVTRTGINVWDEETQLGRWNGSVGDTISYTSDNTRFTNKNAISVLPNTEYYFSATDDYDIFILMICDTNNVVLAVVNTNSPTFTTPANSAFLYFYPYTSGKNTYNNDICINISNTAINGTYYPYKGTNTITATFDNTVYSGHVDFTTGVLTVDKAMVDLGDLTWNIVTTGTTFAPYFYTADVTNIKMNSIISMNGICSNYKVVDRVEGTFINGCLCGNGTPPTVYIQVKDDRFTDATTFTTAMSGVQLLYELATPQTIQLTPQQLSMLKGYNTVTTDANGGMTIKYQPDNVIGELKKEINEVDDKIPTTPFDGKKVLFIGDSFMEGFGARVADGLDSTTNPITTPVVADSTPMRGWAKTFQERYPKAIVHNISIYGATIAYQDNAPSVMGQLTYIATNSIGGEYVVLDGGANDVFQGITKGSAKADDVYEEMNWNTMNYNTYQTIPCLEAIFAIFAEHYPTVRLLYVSPPPMDVTLTEEMQTAMDTMNTEIEALCEKWGVKYIKIIGKGSKNTIYSNNTEYYTASDKIHPLQRFYDETIGQIDEVLKQF